MLTKELKIPKYLWELHGEKARLSTVVMVYVVGLAASMLFLMNLLTEVKDLTLWKVIILWLLYFDIAGGVVANLSSSTNSYYRDKKGLRIIFLVVHVIHPLLFSLIFPDMYPYFSFMFLYTIAVAFLVNSLKDIELQQNIASSLVVIGIVISMFFKHNLVVLYSVAPLFMLKLGLGFAVRRPSFVQLNGD